jgi:hypothetical protein
MVGEECVSGCYSRTKKTLQSGAAQIPANRTVWSMTLSFITIHGWTSEMQPTFPLGKNSLTSAENFSAFLDLLLLGKRPLHLMKC